MSRHESQPDEAIILKSTYFIIDAKVNIFPKPCYELKFFRFDLRFQYILKH